MRCPACRNKIAVDASPTEPRADEPPPAAEHEVAAPQPQPKAVAASGPPSEAFVASDPVPDGHLAPDEEPIHPLRAFVAEALTAIEEETGLPRKTLALIAGVVVAVFGTGVVGGLLLRSSGGRAGAVAVSTPAPAWTPQVAPRPSIPPSAPAVVAPTPARAAREQGVAQIPARVGPPSAPPPVVPVAVPLPPQPQPQPAIVAAAPQPDRLETVRRIKDATVYLKVGGGEAASSGSGFVVRVDGGTIYVATNHHVVEPPEAGRGGRREDDDEAPAWPPITAVFRSGDTNGREVSRPARVVAHDRQEQRDLALLAVDGVPDAPRPIDVAKRAEPVETTPLYIHGFPFGDLDRLVDRNNRRNPSITISGGRVSSLRRDEGGRIALVQVDGSVNPGNSGGPVVDEEGRLVGVAVAQLANVNIGFAVPAADLARMLDGRVGRIRVRPAATRPGEVDLDVRANLIDPFGNLRSVEMLTGGEPAPPDHSRTDWPELPNARRTPLDRRGDAAGGLVRVFGEPGRPMTVQVCVRDSSGRAFVDRPFTFVIPPAAGAVATNAEGAPDRPPPAGIGPLIDPSRSCSLARNGERLTIEIPPGVYALGPDFTPRTAPMALTEVEGDFDARVQLDGAMLPGLEPVKLKGRLLPNTYQGAGLILYEDRNNYLRVERGASAQRSHPEVSSEVVIEIRDNGRAEPPLVQRVPEGPLDVRILRSRDAVRCMVGRDGHWFATHQLAVRFPEKVRVGLIATNLSKERHVARFLKPSLVLGEPKEE